MTNRFESARDLRQLRFMLSAIRAFESGAASQSRLRRDLDELFLMLSDDNQRWRKQFLDALKPLEKNPSKAVKRLGHLLEAEIKQRERNQAHG